METRNQEAVYAFGRWRVDLGQRELLADGLPVPMGGRAFEIIEVLVRSAGAIIAKDELMNRIWPGAAVEENTLHAHISAVRKAFGPDRELLRTESGRGYRLIGPWSPVSQGAPADLPAAERPSPAPVYQTNVPLSASELIGRTSNARQLLDLMAASRIVTLTGPGGIGKTRLALHVARSLIRNFPGDAWFVELASVSDPRLVCFTVASVLGQKLGGQEVDPLSVARAIGDAKLLLVLDNCEHVIEAVAALAETIVGSCQGVRLLATSRELMRINGEVGFQVAPLDVPGDYPLESRELLGHSAVQLFIARMQAPRNDVAEQDESLRTIAAICRRLDGIPLAIELAAARASALGLDYVASRLEDRFNLLVGGRRTALPRHQTLRATLDWSYELLPEPERRVLRFAAVFASGFTLEAVAAVLDEARNSAMCVLDGITNLVSKSLLVIDEGRAATRWRLLENTREYGLAKLAERGEAELARRRHATYYCDFLEQAAERLSSIGQTERLEFYGQHVGNVASALRWAFSANGDVAIGVALANASAPLFLDLSLLIECQRWVAKAIESLDHERGGRREAELYASLAMAMTYSTGDGARTREVILKGLNLAENLGDPNLELRMLYSVHMLCCAAGDLRRSLVMAQRAEAIARRTADTSALAVANAMLGVACTLSGDQATAAGAIRRLLDLSEVLSSVNTAHFGHNYYLLAKASHARNLWHRGYPDQAKRVASESIRDAETLGHPVTLALCLVWTVPVFRWLGDREGARLNTRKLAEFASKRPRTMYWAAAEALTGQLLIEEGEAEAGIAKLCDAVTFLLSSRRVFLSLGFTGYLAEALAATGRIDDALAAIDDVIARADAGGGFFGLPEMFRLKGQILAARKDEGAAEANFVRAQELARQQSALSWELRTAVSLARLWSDQGHRGRAREMLSAVHGRFGEGFDSQDLQTARALLDALVLPVTEATCR